MNLAQKTVLRHADVQGWTVAHWVAYKGHVRLAKYLLDFGADFRIHDAAGYMPVHRACVGHQLGVVQLLLERKVLLPFSACGEKC